MEKTKIKAKIIGCERFLNKLGKPIEAPESVGFLFEDKDGKIKELLERMRQNYQRFVVLIKKPNNETIC